MLKVGSEGLYEWLVPLDKQFDLLQLCPDIALGKYIAITSFDSGPLVLTNKRMRLVGKVEAISHTAQKFKTSQGCRVQSTTSGTFLAPPLTLVQTTLEKTCLKCRKRRDT